MNGGCVQPLRGFPHLAMECLSFAQQERGVDGFAGESVTKGKVVGGFFHHKLGADQLLERLSPYRQNDTTVFQPVAALLILVAMLDLFAVNRGVIASPLSKYANYNTRICRPIGLSAEDRAKKRVARVAMLLGLAVYHAIVLPSVFALGPVLADEQLDGAASWAIITAAFGAGAVAGQLLLLRWRPRRERGDGGDLY